MTDGTRSDGSAVAGRPGEVVLSSAMAEVRQWAAHPDTDAAHVGTSEGGERDGPQPRVEAEVADSTTALGKEGRR
jgi:hypothetical protein